MAALPEALGGTVHGRTHAQAHGLAMEVRLWGMDGREEKREGTLPCGTADKEGRSRHCLRHGRQGRKVRSPP